MYKKIVLALSGIFAGGAALAGGLSNMVSEQVVMTPEAVPDPSSTPSWVVPVVVLGALLLLAGANGSGSSYDY